MREDHTEALVEVFHNTARQQTFQKNQVIIQAGEKPLGIYLITDGWIRGVSPCDNGDINIIQTYFPGSILPLPWLLTDTLPTMSFIANTKTNVLRMSHADFNHLLFHDSDFSVQLLKLLAAQKLSLAEEHTFLHYKSARQRVVYRLLTLANRFGYTRGSVVTLTTRVTNEYIARSTHMTRETASREMNKLIRNGLVSHHNGRYVIRDYHAFQSLLAGP